jgi:hypothetical protein
VSSIEGNIYNSDQKFAESKDGFVGLMFSNISRVIQILSNPELGNISTNVYLIGQTMISQIPDSEVRKELRKKLKDRIEELKKERGENISEETKRYVNVLATTEIIGDIMDNVDLYCGIVKENRISFDKDCGECKYKKLAIEIHPDMVK